MKLLTQKAQYRSFIAKRDAALEGLLLKAQAKIADDLRHFMAVLQIEVQRSYPTLSRGFLDPFTQRQLKGLEDSIDRHAQMIAVDMALHWTTVRYYTALLTQAGEQQATINVLGGTPQKVTKDSLHTATYKPGLAGDIHSRTYLALTKIRRKVMDAIDLSRVLDDDIVICMQRVLKVFPTPQRVTSKRVLKRFQEADHKKDLANTNLDITAFMDKEDWSDLVKEYKAEFVPKWRDPKYGELESPVSIGSDKDFIVYPWELEKELTDDFVATVVDGTNVGAKAQGITDFVWIAILDDRTDLCCAKRDGLTTTEIAAKLESEWSSDKCRATAPPAHFNCRCRIAPATDDLPEAPTSNAPDFEEWLNS